MTTALARLIKEAPDIAREVMQVEGVDCTISDDGEISIDTGMTFYGHAVTMNQPPAWFYSAVAGKLAEWLGSRRQLTISHGSDGRIWVCVRGVTYGCDTFLDAIVEAAIVVGREGK